MNLNNKVTYSKDSFSFEDFKKIFEHMEKNRPSRTLTLHTSILGGELIDAETRGDKKRVAEIHAIMEEQARLRHLQVKATLISLWGEEEADFLEFLAWTFKPKYEYPFAYISSDPFWSLGSTSYEGDDENDESDYYLGDSYSLVFKQNTGKYYFREDIEGGYGGASVYEVDKELIKKIVALYVKKDSIKEIAKTFEENKPKEDK